jgi:serine/threonine-protein kinase
VPEPKKVKAESDVPLWMMSIMIGAVAAAVFLAGFYYVYINFDRQRMVIVPNLKGLSSSEARSSLQGLRLKYKAGPSVPSDRIEADHIIEADPSPGSRVPENTQVTVTISTGSREVTVPSLKGLTPDKARQALATVNLQLDDQMDHASDPSLPDGVILAQSPDSGAKADSSRKIHVTVNTPSAPSLSPPAPSGAPAANPNQPSMEAGTYVYTISFALDNVSEPVHVRMEVTDDDGARTFYEQDNNPGDNIDTKVKAKGSQATFRIYYDDRMVKEFTKQAKESGE